MSTLIEDVQAVLEPLAGGGAWYGACTLQPPPYPYIVFQRVFSAASVALGGPSDLQNTRFQIDVYSRSVQQVDAIGAAIDAAFAANPITNVPLGTQDFYEDDTKAHRVSKDFSIWATN